MPEAVWVEPDPAALGTPFYVMSRVDGDVPDDIMYSSEGWLFEASRAEQRRVQTRPFTRWPRCTLCPTQSGTSPSCSTRKQAESTTQACRARPGVVRLRGIAGRPLPAHRAGVSPPGARLAGQIVRLVYAPSFGRPETTND